MMNKSKSHFYSLFSSLHTTWKSSRGVSLITAILIMAILSTLCVGTISLVVTDNRITANQNMLAQAFWIAEGGLEVTLDWLRDQAPPPGGTAPLTQFDQVALGNGTFTVIIDPDDNNPNTYINSYEIKSIGQVGPITRELRITAQMNTFSRYAYLSGDEGGTIWFTTGDVISGPLHSNDRIAIWSSPIFLGKVTSSAGSFQQGGSFNPTFKDGFQLNAPTITFPTIQDVSDNYWAMNDDPPNLIIDARFGKKSEVVFQSDGTIKYSIWYTSGSNRVYAVEDEVVDLDDLNGIIFVKGKTRIKGTVNGAVTVVATDKIWIIDDIKYADSGVNGEPNPGCDDYLGIISKKDIMIQNNQANRDDVIIDAAILALGNSFKVQNHSSGSPRGYIHFWGSLSQKVRGAVGTFGGGGTGYLKDYNYDQRFLDSSPPYFPTTGSYTVMSWRDSDF
jgi:hypothetical protein